MFDLRFSSFSQVVVVLGSVDVVHRYDRHEHGDDGEIGEDRADGSLWCRFCYQSARNTFHGSELSLEVDLTAACGGFCQD